MMMMISQFNGTSTPKGSYSAKTGVWIHGFCPVTNVEIIHKQRTVSTWLNALAYVQAKI